MLRRPLRAELMKRRLGLADNDGSPSPDPGVPIVVTVGDAGFVYGDPDELSLPPARQADERATVSRNVRLGIFARTGRQPALWRSIERVPPDVQSLA